MRLHEIVTELIDEDLIARVHRAARDNLTAPVGATGEHIEIVLQRFRRRIDKMVLVLTNQAR